MGESVRISLPLFALLLLCSGRAYAGDPSASPSVAAAPCPSTSLCVTADEAKRALLTAAALASCEERETVLRADHESELAAARHDESTERERADSLAKLLADASKIKPLQAPWWERPWFVATVAAAAGVALALTSVYLAGSL